MTEQTSASDRYEAARKALAEYDTEKTKRYPYTAASESMATALRALITPPGIHESEEQIVQRVLNETPDGANFNEVDAIRMAVHAGIQSAHESWEPEVALRPTQEQMLRWLGISYAVGTYGADDVPCFHILTHVIERED